MTLKDYYESLPSAQYPKTEFIADIAERCGVSMTTVRNWIKTDIKPINPACAAILSEACGIPVEELWERSEQ